MASAAVIAAVKSRQQAGWNTTPVIYPNEKFELPSDPAPFIEVDFPIAASDQASLGAPGANRFRDLGTIRFIISTRNDVGTDTATQYANELSDLFRAQVFDGVITYAPSPPVYLGADGNYGSWSISVPYKYDHQE
jgi:hypothetical protein